MFAFKPRKVIDPKTGKERIITPEEQEDLLERGVIIDAPAPSSERDNSENTSNHGKS